MSEILHIFGICEERLQQLTFWTLDRREQAFSHMAEVANLLVRRVNEGLPSPSTNDVGMAEAAAPCEVPVFQEEASLGLELEPGMASMADDLLSTDPMFASPFLDDLMDFDWLEEPLGFGLDAGLTETLDDLGVRSAPSALRRQDVAALVQHGCALAPRISDLRFKELMSVQFRGCPSEVLLGIFDGCRALLAVPDSVDEKERNGDDDDVILIE